MRPLLLALPLALVLGGWAGVVSHASALARSPGTGALDRLERFRELALSRLSAAQILESEHPDQDYREIYALLDDEIVESLSSGSVFASIEFLQDRLDAFGEAWGGATFKLARLGRFVVGTFQLGQSGNSIRVYGRLRDEAALLTAMYRDGRPTVHALAPPAAGQFLAAWEGTPSGWGTRGLRVDLVRPHGDGVRVAWSTADVFPDGLVARGYSVRAGEVRVRYEVHYPGWAPGCAGQTEREDLYRLAPSGAALVRVSRQEHNAWHRDFRSSVAQLFAALAARDAGALAVLVPDRALRARLPALVAEPACDAPEGPERDPVSVAAVTADHRPWSLTFRRAGARWRLTAATPVLH